MNKSNLQSFRKLTALMVCSFALVACGGNSQPEPTAVVPPIEVTSNSPRVSVPSYKYVNAGDSVQIIADASDDLGVEKFLWESLSGPEVTLTGINSDTISFTAPSLESGRDLSLRITVTDAQNQTAYDVVEININPMLENTSDVNVSVPVIDGLDFDDSEMPLVIVSGGTLTQIISSGTITVPIPNDQKNYITAVSTAEGTPLLTSFADPEDGQIEISIESSADAFVMRSPRFFGTQITDKKELSRRIRSHPRYSKLVGLLAEQVRISPCPMKQSCSVTAARNAEIIAQEVELEGLRVLGE